MATPVPAVERAVSILALLASEPEQSLNASDIATRLGISKATCFSILVALRDRGLLRRHDDQKTYSLGPELVHLGWAAIEQVPGTDLARQEMFDLSRRLDIAAMVCIMMDDELVVLDRVTVEGQVPGIPGIDGLRTPAKPPLGSIYHAWSPPAVVEAWLERSGCTGDQERDVNRLAIQAIRAKGYSIGGGVELQLQAEELLARLGDSEPNEQVEVALMIADLVRAGARVGEVGPAAHPVTFIIAPIFGHGSEVVLTLSLVGRLGQLNDHNVEDFAGPLLAAAARVTSAIGGRRPDGIGSAPPLGNVG